MILTLIKQGGKQILENEMKKIGVDDYGIKIMLPKANNAVIKIDEISNIAANIIKQQMLSLGGDAAISRSAIKEPEKKTGVLLIGSENVFEQLKNKLKIQPFGLQDLSIKIDEILKNYESQKNVLIMGILNLTPDSFFDGAYYYQNVKAAIDRVVQMINCGANIIDIGGESTRPGASYITLEEERDRVIPLLKELKNIDKKNIIISIDTNKSEIAKQSLELGASMINDISGLRKDKNLVNIISDYNASVVIMHAGGNPENMQENPVYDDIIKELIYFFDERIEFALKNNIKKDKILIDPGIGFGKSVEHNLLILNRLEELKILGVPIVIGISRKSFIGNIINRDVSGRLSGSIAANLFALNAGANILRVHDVEETVDAVRVWKAITEIK